MVTISVVHPPDLKAGLTISDLFPAVIPTPYPPKVP